MKCYVKFIWNDESEKWHTETDDVLCLALEDYSLDALINRVRIAAPEMIELNSGYKGIVNIFFTTERMMDLNMASVS